MEIGVLGTGMVGATIGRKLASLGHDVKMGSRTAGGDKARAWVASAGKNASEGTFAQAAAHGRVVFNCTSGSGAIPALTAAGADRLAGKIVVDVSNPLDFSKGQPPSLFVGNTDSLGEQIQRAFPAARVVKTLNTVNCNLMVDASLVPGEHDMFVAGNDAAAKDEVTAMLKDWFGWRSVCDLGDISAARAMEGYLLLWVRLWGRIGNANFNLRIVRA
jgi:predicted dinucleotide-binding enzyme